MPVTIRTARDLLVAGEEISSHRESPTSMSEPKLLLVDFELMKELVEKANPDCLIQWRWPDKPIEMNVIVWEPSIVVVRPDTADDREVR
jgi:hypothetical protein